MNIHNWRKIVPLKTEIMNPGNVPMTIITNLVAVAQDLNRDPKYILKFFGFELDCYTIASCPERPTGLFPNYTICGKYTISELENALDIFIDKYVLCSNCQSCITTFDLYKDPVELYCYSCGHHRTLDYVHKFMDFLKKELKWMTSMNELKKQTKINPSNSKVKKQPKKQIVVQVTSGQTEDNQLSSKKSVHKA